MAIIVKYLDVERQIIAVTGVVSTIGDSFLHIEVTKPSFLTGAEVTIRQSGVGYCLILPDDKNEGRCLEKGDD